MLNEWSEMFASALSCDRPLNAQPVTTQDDVLDRHVNAKREAARKQLGPTPLGKLKFNPAFL